MRYWLEGGKKNAWFDKDERFSLRVGMLPLYRAQDAWGFRVDQVAYFCEPIPHRVQFKVQLCRLRGECDGPAFKTPVHSQKSQGQ